MTSRFPSSPGSMATLPKDRRKSLSCWQMRPGPSRRVPQCRDPPSRVPDASRCPNCRHSLSSVIPPLLEGSLPQDLASPFSQSPEEVPDLDISLVPGPESSTSPDPELSDAQVSDPIPDASGSIPLASRPTAFEDKDQQLLERKQTTAITTLQCGGGFWCHP